MHTLKSAEEKKNYEGLLSKERSSFLVLCGVGIMSAKGGLVERLVKLLSSGVTWLMFNTFGMGRGI